MVFFFFSSRRRHTRCALVTGVQTCALPIYAQASYALTDMFTLTAGARYTRDDKDITALNATAGVTPPAVTLDKSFEAFTPKLAVEFRPSDDTLEIGRAHV